MRVYIYIIGREGGSLYTHFCIILPKLQLGKEAEQRLGDFNPQEFANTAWAFAKGQAVGEST